MVDNKINFGEQFYNLNPYGQNINKEAEEQFLNNCGNLKSDRTEGRDEYIQNNPKIRFIVLAMGLPGSGKTSAIKLAQNYCKLLNSTAVRNNKWLIENISHDFQITSSVRYQKAIRALLFNYRNEPFWTSENWSKLSYKEKNIIEKQFNTIYNNIRYGEAITKSDGGRNFQPSDKVENIRRENIRTYGFSNEKNRLLEHKKRISQIVSTAKKPYSKQQVNKMMPIIHTTSSGVYTNLRKGITNGNNLAYEFIGSNWTTVKKFLEVIVESTNNCKKYTYVIIGTFNLISLQTAYKRMLCRFFKDSEEFISFLKDHGTFYASQRYPLSNNNFDKIPSAPRLGCSMCKKQNDKLCKNMIDLLNCNINYNNSKRYHGDCKGVGIDLMLYIHNSPQKYQQDNILETIPLSKRSMHLIKTTGVGDKSISNTKKQKNFIIDLLNRIRKASAQWRPLENEIIECPDKSDYIETYIQELFSLPSYTKADILKTRVKTIQQKGMLPIYKKGLKTGGKKKRRKKTRKKQKKHNRKTRSKRGGERGGADEMFPIELMPPETQTMLNNNANLMTTMNILWRSWSEEIKQEFRNSSLQERSRIILEIIQHFLQELHTQNMGPETGGKRRKKKTRRKIKKRTKSKYR